MSPAMIAADVASILDYDHRSHRRDHLERMLLGVILEELAMKRAQAFSDLRASDFFYPWHAEIYRACEGAEDLSGVVSALDTERLAFVGGLTYLALCMDAARPDLLAELVTEVKKCPRCAR